jgi:Domain of unknown function (DUF4166)
LASLFRRLAGASYETLPAAVLAMHEGAFPRRFAGRSTVERGSGLLARLLGAISSLPPAAQSMPVSITITQQGEGERWARDFDGHPLVSRMGSDGGLLTERVGPNTFYFELTVADGAIVWRLVGVRCLGVPLPASWFLVRPRESAEAGRYRFDVRVELPLVGLVVHYRGTLDAAA